MSTKKPLFLLLFVLVLFSCATTQKYNDISVYNARFGKGFDPFKIETYRAVSEAYIKYATPNTIFITDNYGDDHGLELQTGEFSWGRFDPEKRYTIRYSITFNYTGSPTSARLDSIDGLEYQSTRDQEEERIRIAMEERKIQAAIEEGRREHERREADAERQRKVEEKQMAAEAEAALKQSEAENSYSEALSTRNADTIMEYIISHRNKAYFNDAAYLEVAKLITKNNSVDFERINTALNPYSFNENKVYFCIQLLANQFIERKIIASFTGFYVSPDDRILLQNIPDIQSIGNLVQNVYLRYVGVTQLKLANGGMKEVATFDVLYHYQF